jgi:hypothetical protein
MRAIDLASEIEVLRSPYSVAKVRNSATEQATDFSGLSLPVPLLAKHCDRQMMK